MRYSWLQNAPKLVAGDAVSVPIAGSTPGPLTTGSLVITVIGPPDAQPAIKVTGPSGFQLTIAGTTTLSNLVPGSYTIDAMSVVVANVRYGAAPMTDEPVLASSTPSEVTVTYRPSPALKIGSDTPPRGTVGAVYGVGSLGPRRRYSN